MVSKNIKLKNFNFKINNGRIKKDLKILLKEDNEIIRISKKIPVSLIVKKNGDVNIPIIII